VSSKTGEPRWYRDRTQQLQSCSVHDRNKYRQHSLYVYTIEQRYVINIKQHKPRLGANLGG